MTTAGRVASGASLGVLAASLATPAMMTFWGKPGSPFEPALLLAWLFFGVLVMTFLAGPGALFLAWIHAVLVGRWARHANSRGEIRTLSVLLGIPLGVANLVLVLAVSALFSHKDLDLHPGMAPLLLPAVAGGAGLGWGVTLGLRPGGAARVRTPALPRVRRDGPPFFDNRRAP